MKLAFSACNEVILEVNRRFALTKQSMVDGRLERLPDKVRNAIEEASEE